MILSASGAESMMLSDTLSAGNESAESIILSALPAESMILSALPADATRKHIGTAGQQCFVP